VVSKDGARAEEKVGSAVRTKELEEEVGRLRRQLAEKRDADAMEQDGDDDDELVEEEDSAKGDIPHLAALSALLDSSTKELGKDDPSTSALRQRVEAARAAQRASKPAMQQLQRGPTAGRKAG
jgi:hypothetical protein